MALDPVFIPFGEWSPDRMDWQNTGSPDIQNVVPDDADGYLPQQDLDSFTNALDNYFRGGLGTIGGDGTSYVYVGDESKIYSLGNATFSNISETGGYSCGTDDLWEFKNYQNNIIATNYTNNMQAMAVGGSLMQSIPGTGSPPKAKYIETYNRFLTCLYTNDSVDGEQPARFRWSAIDDHTSWTVSTVTLADYEELDIDDGPGMGLAVVGAREFIFQQKAITLCSFIGAPVVMQIDKIESGRGLFARKAFCVWGNVIYYLSQDGFYALIGAVSQPIGSGKINKWFFNDLDISYLNRITCEAKPSTGEIYWSYPGADNINGLPNKYVCFNPRSNRWSYGDLTTQGLLIGASAGYTLEQLDNISSSLDTLSESLDSPVWKGGELTFAGFDVDNKMGFFSGSELTAKLTTREADLENGRFVMLQGVKIVADGGTHSAEVGYRRTLSDALTWTGSANEQSRSGITPIRANAPFMRCRASLAGGFTNARGVYFYATPSGRR